MRRIFLLIISLFVLSGVCILGSEALLVSGLAFDNDKGLVGVGRAGRVGGLTLLGILASLVVSALRSQKPNSPLNVRAVGMSILYPQTFIAICVGPVVFFGALLALEGKDLGPAGYLSAFQNGFFWQRVLDTHRGNAQT